MSNWEKDYERYVERYAKDRCNGDIEIAKTHMLVQEVKKHYQEESAGKC